MTINRQWVLSAETQETSSIVQTDTVTILPEITSVKTRTGSYAYRSYLNMSAFGQPLKDTVSAVRIGYWVNHVGADPRPDPLCLYIGTDGVDVNTHAAFYVYVDTQIQTLNIGRPTVAAGIASLASTPIPSRFLHENVWLHIGVTHLIDAVSGYCSVYLDGTQVLTYTGDTRLFGRGGGAGYNLSTIPRVMASGKIDDSPSGWDAYAYTDDFYCDSYEGELDASVPSYRFLPRNVIGAGADAGYTPVGSVNNYENVDENPNNGDTDYNKATSAGLRDTFSLSSVSVPTDHIITAHIPFAYAKRLDAGTPSQISVHNFDGLTYDDSANLDLGMDYYPPVFARFPLQPDGSAWNETDVNSMQSGYASRGSF